MKSIRTYLALRLLIGFMVVLSLASVIVYFISKQILETDFDGRLFAKAQAVVASTSQKGNALDVDWGNLPQEMGAYGRKPNFIEFRDVSGNHLDGEPFLNSPVAGSDQALYRNALSLQGRKIRVLTLTFLPSVEEEDIAITPPGLRRPCLLIVGSDREQLDHSLGLMAGVLAIMTIATSILSLGIVSFVLRRGLQPLALLSREVSQINELSLNKRIDLHLLPVEVLPMAEKLNDLLGRLETSFARERRFSADISHELRTPVAELKTLSEVMLQQPDLSTETRLGFEDALAVARQMESLVIILLEMVRQEEGRTALRLSQVDLQDFVLTLWKKFEAKAAHKRIQLKVVQPARKLILETEPQLLSMALANLFDNAIEYSPSGSTIDCEFQQENSIPCLVISNPTSDLAPEDLPHLFERFWRKDKARGESTHFGIGLALTRTLCQRIGIQLTASIDRENLVRFWLRLPAQGVMRES